MYLVPKLEFFKKFEVSSTELYTLEVTYISNLILLIRRHGHLPDFQPITVQDTFPARRSTYNFLLLLKSIILHPPEYNTKHDAYHLKLTERIISGVKLEPVDHIGTLEEISGTQWGVVGIRSSQILVVEMVW